MNTLRTPFSRHLFRYSCIFCASILLPLLLGGCSYFDTSGHDELQVSKSMDDIEIVDQPLYPPEPVNVAEVVARSTEGRVQIFDLDAPFYEDPPAYRAPQSSDAFEVSAAPVVPVNARAPAVPVFSADPSVQIFPFDDQITAPSSFEPITAAPQPIRKEEYVRIDDPDGNKVIVYFDHDSATLNGGAAAQIDALAKSFNNVAGQGLTVEGHASIRANYNDEAQRRVVNLKISMDRAFAVASALIKRGIPAEAIRVMAWGDAMPPRSLNGKSQEDAARRVEISG